MRDRHVERRVLFYTFVARVLILGGLGLCVLASCLMDAAFAKDAETVAFLGLLNRYRASHGLNALTEDDRLDTATQWMAEDRLAPCKVALSGCAHTDSLGRSLGLRLAAYGVTGVWAAGNIAWGSGYSVDQAGEVLRAWQNSPDHNAAMLAPEARRAGAGRACDSSGFCFWVLNEAGDPSLPAGATPPVVATATPHPTASPTVAPTATTGGRATPTPVVPEPGTSTLFVSGLSALLWRLRCRS
jgi:hypothetical protein